MSSNNIIRLNVDNSNPTSQRRPLGFNIVNTFNFIDNAIDYEVYVEKCEIPIPEDLPKVVVSGSVNVVLERTDKNDHDPLFGDHEYVTYTIPNQFKDLNEIVNEINNVLLRLSTPYRWAELKTDGKLIEFVVNANSKDDKTKIWIDGIFWPLFKQLPVRNEGYLIQQHEYFELYNVKATGMPGTYIQMDSFVADMYNLKTFRFYSTLPTEDFWLYNQQQGTMIRSNLLTEIVYNTKEMTGNSNLLYIPGVFRYTSLQDAGSISKFDLRVSAYYFNGEEVPLWMDRNAYVSITLVFVKKEKI